MQHILLFPRYHTADFLKIKTLPSWRQASAFSADVDSPTQLRAPSISDANICAWNFSLSQCFMDALTAVFHSSDLFPHCQSHRTPPAANLILAAAGMPNLGQTPSPALRSSRGALKSSGLSHVWPQFTTLIDEMPPQLIAVRLLWGCCAKVVFHQRERQRVSRADGGLSQHEAAVSEHSLGAVPEL